MVDGKELKEYLFVGVKIEDSMSRVEGTNFHPLFFFLINKMNREKKNYIKKEFEKDRTVLKLRFSHGHYIFSTWTSPLKKSELGGGVG